jgi:ABC-type nitrate/sulfonate/bicarbonate transport system substrate-binding protein
MNIQNKIIAILTVTTIIISASISTIKNQTPELKQVNVKLKWLHQAQFAGMYVAKEKGFYKKYGLDVTLTEKNKGSDNVVDDVISGAFTFGITSPLELIKEIEHGKPVTAIMAIYQNSPSIFISKLEANITTPSDFKHKRIGTVSNEDNNKIFINAILKNFNINNNEVTFVNRGFEPIKYLLSDQIDVTPVYRTTDLYELEKNNIKYNLIKPEDYNIPNYDDIIITETSTITNQESLVRNFIRATKEGWEYAINNPDEAAEISFKNTNKMYTSKGVEYQKFIIEQSKDLIKSNNSQSIGDMNHSKWYQQYRLLKDQGLISNVDVKKIYQNITE